MSGPNSTGSSAIGPNLPTAPFALASQPLQWGTSELSPTARRPTSALPFAGVLVTSPSLSRLRPVCRSGDFCGLMIDDFVHCAQVPLSDDGSAAPSWQRTQAEGKMHALRQAYEDSGLPRHPDKAVWGLPDAEVWGSEILGKQGLVRPNFKRSIPLVGCVAEMLDLRRTSVRLLEVISGSFVSVFQFRRRLMCLLSEVQCAGRRPADGYHLHFA